VRGVAAHAASGLGENAIGKSLPIIQWFLDHGMQVTQINAGTQHNIVPDCCTFVVDCRTVGRNQEVLDKILPEVSCEVKPRSTRLNGTNTPLTHPLVVAGRAIGLETYSSPTLSNQALCSFPTIKLGPGESARSHTAGEYILLSEVDRAVEVYLALFEAYENLG
jgi:acetylornithine deacetylase